MADAYHINFEHFRPIRVESFLLGLRCEHLRAVKSEDGEWIGFA